MECLQCKRVFPARLHGDRPTPGGLLVCLQCSHVMAFADDLSVRPLTQAEASEATAFGQSYYRQMPEGHWFASLLFLFITIMVALERLGWLARLH